MQDFRHFLSAHRRPAAWLVALALVMKVLVPAGYMPVFSHGSIALELCSGYGPEKMAMPGMDRHGDKPGAPMKDDMPCGFGGHAGGAMAGVDPILLIVALSFIAATVFRRPLVSRLRPIAFLRPPLRGPPATI